MERDPPPRRGHDLRDPAAHLAGADHQHVRELHGGGPYPSAMIVRPARTPDAEAIERIRVRGWQVGYRHLYPAAELDALELDSSRWTQRIERPPPGWATYVAEGRGRTLGFVSVGPSRDEQESESCRRSRRSRRVVARRRSRAHRPGEERLAEQYAEATLWVLEDNPRARRFYECAGWLPDGGRQKVERLGVSPPEVRYRKRFRPPG